MNENRTITLPDGRTLGFATYGDPEGSPVVLFHGTPGSRLGGRIFDRESSEISCRLIATDRPGYGNSSMHPGRKLTDHAHDVAALCETLRIDRFAVAGASGGTPYVLACAALLSDRITAGAIVSGFYGLDDPVDPAELADEVRLQFEQIRENPELSRPNFDGALAMLKDIDPQTFMRQSVASSPEWVRTLVESDPTIGEAFVDHHREALRNGSDGGVAEMALNTNPWGIDLAAISAEIRLWHGGKDPVPRSHVDAVAGALAHSSVSWHEDCGHVDCVLLMPEILRWLVTTF